ncbi:MAG: hypothetical protein LQ346_005414 [Caloplaca aetnensis]|nr:MAG: hypothetical protein LQ346_005414 [Caloplaca aetnensis]
MAPSTPWRRFIRAQSNYEPQIEYHEALGKALDDFDALLLAQETSIWSVRTDRVTRQLQEVRLESDELSARLAENVDEPPPHDFFFVNRYLRKSGQDPVPEDGYKLRISTQDLRLLVSHCNVSASFLFALSRFYLPNGRSFQCYGDTIGSQLWRQWFFLPVRVQVPCSDKDKPHKTSATGSNQMNPFHYLHLPDMDVDIRGFQLAIHVSHDTLKEATTAVCFNFMDGRWARIVEEPQNRISEALRDPRTPPDPMFVHLVWLTSITRWWNHALHSVNEQLIVYEGMLQEENMTEDSSVNGFYNEGSKALHAMAAHIQRYGTELDSLEDTSAELARWLHTLQRSRSALLTSIEQVRSQLKATNAFVKEQEKKTQNILALLFNRMQITNDRRMEAILRATQQEAAYSRQVAERSQELTEEMKKDSVAMKTIAIMTLFFLPATSFAAVLAMPFFSGNEYLSNVTAAWVWVILTIPTTAVAYAFYHFWRKHEAGKSP